MSVVGAFLAALIPLGSCSALFLGCGCFGGYVFFFRSSVSCSHLLHGARWLRVCLFLGFCVPLGTGVAFFLRVRPLVPFGGCLLLEMGVF